MFRVLSLDGVESRVPSQPLPSLALRKLRVGPLADCFDLIIGTSTGGILALGLAFGSKQIPYVRCIRRRLLRYSQRMPVRLRVGLRGWFEPKYNTEGLERALVDISKIANSAKRNIALLSPLFDAISGRPVVFRSPALNPQSKHHDLKVVQVALATSAAPTFFPASKIAQTEPRVLLDGGVWANCRSLSVSPRRFIRVTGNYIR